LISPALHAGDLVVAGMDGDAVEHSLVAHAIATALSRHWIARLTASRSSVASFVAASRERCVCVASSSLGRADPAASWSRWEATLDESVAPVAVDLSTARA
jgi:hypothetical protein